MTRAQIDDGRTFHVILPVLLALEVVQHLGLDILHFAKIAVELLKE